MKRGFINSLLVLFVFVVGGCASYEWGQQSSSEPSVTYVGGSKGGKRTVGHKRDESYYQTTTVKEIIHEEAAEDFVDVSEDIYIEEDVNVSPASAQDTYVVKKGDTLWKISGKSEVYSDPTKWQRIFNANRNKLNDPKDLKPGMVLVIPRD